MPDALALTWRQYRLERRMFWRNPSAAFFNFLLPLLFQDAFGWSAVKSGSVVLFVFLGNIAIKPATSFLYSRCGFRAMLVVATAGMAATMVAAAFIRSSTPLAVTAGVLSGLRRPMLGDISVVSAPVVAKERGIIVEEVTREAEGDYESLITVTVETERQSRFVSGTVFADGRPRIVNIKGIRMDAEFAHRLASRSLRELGRLPGVASFLSAAFCVTDPRLQVTLQTLQCPNPVGLAAGFDKDVQLLKVLPGRRRHARFGEGVGRALVFVALAAFHAHAELVEAALQEWRLDGKAGHGEAAAGLQPDLVERRGEIEVEAEDDHDHRRPGRPALVTAKQYRE